MLILTRRPGESIHLGENITVTVVSVKGRQVRLGFEVPEETPVYRDEVYQRVQEQNRLASQTFEQDLLTAAQLWGPTEKE